MTRDTDGNIVPQCGVTYKYDFRVVYCVKEEGHNGKHQDGRGLWKPDRYVPATAGATEHEEVPAEEDGG